MMQHLVVCCILTLSLVNNAYTAPAKEQDVSRVEKVLLNFIRALTIDERAVCEDQSSSCAYVKGFCADSSYWQTRCAKSCGKCQTGGSGGGGSSGGSTGTIQCGIAPLYATSNSAYIVGGTEALKNRYPWQVRIQTCYGRSCYSCGGSIINKEYILTAAHCIKSNDYGFAQENGVNVIVGAHYLDGYESGRQTVSVSRIIPHENYVSKTMENDIALLKLATPLTWTDKIRPVCLPDSDLSSTGSRGKTCVISGWGKLQTGGESADVLQMAYVPIIPDSECAGSGPGKWGLNQIFDTTVCAGQLGSKATCQGDSGGPLVCADGYGADKPFTLIGATSFGGSRCEALPNVFSNVYMFRSWITKNSGWAIPSSGQPTY